MSKRKADAVVEGAVDVQLGATGTSTAGSGEEQRVSFDKIRPHLKKLEKRGELVDVLSCAWKSEDMRKHIISRIGGWASVADPNEMFEYDWSIPAEENEDRCRDGIALNFASNDIRIGSYSGVQKVDAKYCRGGSYYRSRGGCQECSGDEVFNFDMQSKLDGSMRLKVDSYVECRCGGEDDTCEEDSFTAFPIIDSLSTSNK